LAVVAGPLGLLAGLVLLAVVLITQGTDSTNTRASLLSMGLAATAHPELPKNGLAPKTIARPAPHNLEALLTSVAEHGAARTSGLVKALLLSPFIILIASATRLLLIGNYDTTTAIAIAAAGGVVGTLLGTIAPLLPPFLPIICLGAAVTRRWLTLLFAALATALVSTTYAPLSEGRKNAWHSFGHEFLIRAKVFDLQSMWHYWPLAAICAGIGTFLTLWDPPQGLRMDPNSLAVSMIALVFRLAFSAVVGATCAFIALLAQNIYSAPRDLSSALSQGHHRGDLNVTTASEILRRPWVPAELITLKSGAVVVGYTLSTKDKWFVVLNAHDRTIKYIFADNVTDRKICSLEKNIKKQIPAPIIRLQDVNIAPTPPCPDIR
jgi:hypothetical protein